MINKYFAFVLLAVFHQSLVDAQSSNDSQILPVVLWHGMGDTCCFPFSLGAIKKLISQETNGVYVKSVEIGGSLIEDFRSGYFIHPNDQITDACKQIRDDPKLANGYNAIGFSQGGQFLRGLVQRCNSPQMQVLITIGGQHQGIFGLPKCPSLDCASCEYIRRLLSKAAYYRWVQRDLVQATYWHDPRKENEYRIGSTFLSDINNELKYRRDYVKNLQSLKKFVMVKFMNDTMVQPKESQWFGYYTPGQDAEVLTLRQTKLYIKNTLGLREMDRDDKLIFLETEGDHLKFTDTWFKENIIPFLL